MKQDAMLISRLEKELFTMEELLSGPSAARSAITPALRRHMEHMRHSLRCYTAVYRDDDVLQAFPVDIAAFLAGFLSDTRTRTTSKGVGFSAAVCAEGVFILDEERLRLMLEEVVDAAIERSLPSGDIRFEASLQNDSLLFTITDPAHQPASQEGVSFGLDMATHIAQAIGGTLTATESGSAGHTVTLSIPAPAYQQTGEPGLDGMRILIVDDNDLTREVTRDTLEDAGALVEDAADGETAVDMVSNYYAGYYDMVLMDIRLTGIDGYRAAELIREIPWATKTVLPVIALSATDYDMVRSDESGTAINAFCKKPLDLASILYAYHQAHGDGNN